MVASKTDINLYRRVEKNATANPHGFEQINKTERLFEKPTLLCCGGAGSNAHEYDGEKAANGFAKIGHGLLGYPENFGNKNTDLNDIDIVSVVYPESDEKLTRCFFEDLEALRNGKPLPVADSVKSFVEIYLTPLIRDGDGEALPIDEIKRKLRNIQVLSCSQGSVFMQQVGKELSEKMQELGLSNVQVQDALSQVLVVNVGPVMPPISTPKSFTTVNIINYDDTEVHNSYNYRNALKKLCHQQGLLLNNRGEIISAQTAFEEIKDATHIAKPLNILPITTEATQEGFHFQRSLESNQWLVSLSPPITLNGIGDIIKRLTFPNTVRSNSRGVFDDSVSTTEDYTYHQPISYFPYKKPRSSIIQHTEHDVTPRILISSLLINGMNNAVQNNRDKVFKPLATPDKLLQFPNQIEYISSRTEPRMHRDLVEKDGYAKKLHDSLSMEVPVICNNI